MKLSEVKDLVINKGYAIKNDDTVEKLNEVLKYVFPEDDHTTEGSFKYYIQDIYDIKCWSFEHSFIDNPINLSEIELHNKITLEMVVELTKKYTNDMELGSELRKLLNN